MSRVCASDAAPGVLREKDAALVRVASGVSAQPAAAPVGTPAPAEIVSAIIPVLQDDGAVADLHRAYKAALHGEARQIEFIYVLARQSQQALAALSALKRAGEPLTVIVLSRWDGEGAALRSAFQRARGETVLILSASLQVEPRDVPKVLAALDDSDMVVARRQALHSSWFEAAQARLFQWLIRLLFGRTISDPVCRVRAYRRRGAGRDRRLQRATAFLPIAGRRTRLSRRRGRCHPGAARGRPPTTRRRLQPATPAATGSRSDLAVCRAEVRSQAIALLCNGRTANSSDRRHLHGISGDRAVVLRRGPWPIDPPSSWPCCSSSWAFRCSRSA